MATVNGQIAALVASLIKDAVGRATVNELTSAFFMPMNILLEWLPPPAFDVREAGRTAALLWEKVRCGSPEAAALPFGPVAERAFKRVVNHLHGRPGVDRDYAVRRLLETYYFELAMLDLRGTSADFLRDYGFWYHWNEDGEFRDLGEERDLRRAIHRRCALAARRSMRSYPGIAAGDERSLRRAFYRCWRALAYRAPGWHRDGGRRPATVLGFKPPRGPLVPETLPSARLIVPRGHGKNVKSDYSSIEKQSGASLPPLVADLLDIAATVYLGDVYVPRRRASLQRDLIFLLPVRFPAFWRAHSPLLARIIAFLSRNAADLRFLGDDRKVPKTRFQVSVDDRCVSLLSGGLDSFAGATKLIDEKQRPYFVSHYPGPQLRGIQSVVSGSLRNGASLVQYFIPVARSGKEADSFDELGSPPSTVLYQHTRSFLFLSLAAAVALVNGIGRIAVFENGPVALNPSFSEARFNTRTAHPLFLADFAELIKEIFGVEMIIEAPFSERTKGEVVASIGERWHSALKETNSCWAYSKVKVWASDFVPGRFAGSHCGRCLPCVWRRIAMHAAGVPPSADDAYLWDSIEENDWSRWLDRKHITLLADQLRFCMNVQQLSDKALADLCPDFDLPFGSSAGRIAMYRRFADETVGWFSNAASSMFYRREASASPASLSRAAPHSPMLA